MTGETPEARSDKRKPRQIIEIIEIIEIVEIVEIIEIIYLCCDQADTIIPAYERLMNKRDNMRA